MLLSFSSRLGAWCCRSTPRAVDFLHLPGPTYLSPCCRSHHYNVCTPVFVHSGIRPDFCSRCYATDTWGIIDEWSNTCRDIFRSANHQIIGMHATFAFATCSLAEDATWSPVIGTCTKLFNHALGKRLCFGFPIRRILWNGTGRRRFFLQDWSPLQAYFADVFWPRLVFFRLHLPKVPDSNPAYLPGVLPKEKDSFIYRHLPTTAFWIRCWLFDHSVIYWSPPDKTDPPFSALKQQSLFFHFDMSSFTHALL